MWTLVARLAAPIVRALGASVRIEVHGEEHLTALQQGGHPFLFLVWHGRIFLPIHRHRDQGIVAMVSLSRDGDFTAAVLGRLGYGTVRGSSSRGGNQAFHALRERLGTGGAGAIIPDGPRGPARVLKPGALYLAAATGAPILCLSAAAAPAVKLNSWDRFVIPLPFARGVIVYGEPVTLSGSLSPQHIEQVRLDLERRLFDLEARADTLVQEFEARP